MAYSKFQWVQQENILATGGEPTLYAILPVSSKELVQDLLKILGQ